MTTDQFDVRKYREIIGGVSEWLRARSIDPHEIPKEVVEKGGVDLLRHLLALLEQVSDRVAKTDWLKALAAGCEKVEEELASFIDLKASKGEKPALEAFPMAWLHCLTCNDCRGVLEITEETLPVLGTKFAKALTEACRDMGMLRGPEQSADSAGETMTRIVLRVKRQWQEMARALSSLGVRYAVQPVLSLRGEEGWRASGRRTRGHPGEVVFSFVTPSRDRLGCAEPELTEQAGLLRHEFSMDLEEGAATLKIGVEEKRAELWEIVAAVEIVRKLQWQWVGLTVGPQRVDAQCLPNKRLDIRCTVSHGEHECTVEFSGPMPQCARRYEYRLQIEQG